MFTPAQKQMMQLSQRTLKGLRLTGEDVIIIRCPSEKEFIDNAVSLRVLGSAALEPLRGNCSQKRQPVLVDDTHYQNVLVIIHSSMEHEYYHIIVRLCLGGFYMCVI